MTAPGTTTIGVVGQDWRASVTPWGRIEPWDGSEALDWWIAALILAMPASTLLAQRSLHDHVAAVARALEREGLADGRRAVSQIVGRDPDALDEAGVARAAIESLAENFSDGVVAPAFWMKPRREMSFRFSVMSALSWRDAIRQDRRTSDGHSMARIEPDACRPRAWATHRRARASNAVMHVPEPVRPSSTGRQLRLRLADVPRPFQGMS